MMSRSHSQVFTIFLVAVALSLAGCNGLLNVPAPTAQSQTQSAVKIGADVGMAAPDFSASTIDDGKFTLASQRGKPTVLLFLANWCGSCVPEAKALGQLQKEYGERISVVAIDIDPSSTPESLSEFKHLAGDPSLIWVLDPGQKATKPFQVKALETTLILDRTGLIAYRHDLPAKYEALKQELMNLQP